MLLGFKTDLIFFISLYLQHFHCPLGSNVDECLHVDVWTHCQSCEKSLPSCFCGGRGEGGGWVHLFINSLVLFLGF